MTVTSYRYVTDSYHTSAAHYSEANIATTTTANKAPSTDTRSAAPFPPGRVPVDEEEEEEEEVTGADADDEEVAVEVRPHEA